MISKRHGGLLGDANILYRDHGGSYADIQFA